MTTLHRRTFLTKSGLGLLLAPSLQGLMACVDASRLAALSTPTLRRARIGDGGYGEVEPSADLDGMISLPLGFHARLLSQSGDALDSGGTVPYAFDGMGAFAAGPGLVRLVRNHELRDVVAQGAAPFDPRNPYDSHGPAGTTTLQVRVRPDGEAVLEGQWASITGTFVNCAGGVTPWGSWLTCEETLAGTAQGWAQNHGYVFEVPAAAQAPVTPVPLRAMGRFTHEAAAVDPATGYVYETEDAGFSGFYRFMPAVPGNLAQGGTLEMLAIVGADGYDTRTGQLVGARYKVRWVKIDQPDSDAESLPSDFVFSQGRAQGGARFARLEGCFYGDDSIFFNATSGGDAGSGQVWQYIPRREELILVFESPGPSVLNSPDNIAVSPRGGILICEDGEGTNYVRGITRGGLAFDLARNNLNDSEWAGCCFSPEGRTLFVGIQGDTRPLRTLAGGGTPTKGMTFAIWGPWESGAL